MPRGPVPVEAFGQQRSGLAPTKLIEIGRQQGRRTLGMVQKERHERPAGPVIALGQSRRIVLLFKTRKIGTPSACRRPPCGGKVLGPIGRHFEVLGEPLVQPQREDREGGPKQRMRRFVAQVAIEAAGGPNQDESGGARSGNKHGRAPSEASAVGGKLAMP